MGLTGARWNSFDNQDGDTATFGYSAFTGWAVGFDFDDGAYLEAFHEVIIYGCGRAIQYLGAFNAGENIRFYGGGFFNNGTGIYNQGGAEFTLYGTAVDYNYKAIEQNYGRIEYHGVHNEMNLPGGVGDAAFEILGNGSLDWFGGMFLGAGSIGTVPEPPVRLGSPSSKMRFHGTEVYNLSSATGYACSGEGVMSAPGGWKNGGNCNIGPRPPERRGQHGHLWRGRLVQSAKHAPWPAPTPQASRCRGGVYVDPSQTVIDRWNTSVLTVAPTSAEFRTVGSRSVKVTKGGGYNVGSQDAQIVFLIPLEPGQDCWFTLFYRQPDNFGSGTADLYYRAYLVQVTGYDTHTAGQCSARPTCSAGRRTSSSRSPVTPTGTRTGSRFATTRPRRRHGRPTWRSCSTPRASRR